MLVSLLSSQQIIALTLTLTLLYPNIRGDIGRLQEWAELYFQSLMRFYSFITAVADHHNGQYL